MSTGEIGELFVTLRAITEPFTKSLKVAASEGEATTSTIGSSFQKLGGIGVMAGTAIAGIGAVSVKWATDFQAQMAQLNTQAGVAKNQLPGLSDGVLKLAGQVGFSPTSLAEGLYHVESSFASTGITGQKALELLKIGAEGAAVGHSDLVETVNALDATVASGIPGVNNFSQAMGALNAIVGSGDMSMQDLTKAFSTGGLAIVKGYGLSIQDVGAALATFGDNNMRGAASMTNLRMAVQALAVPAKGAAGYLKEFGMTNQTLAKDMQQGGLKQALQDLQGHFTKAGISATEQGQVITEMFGKKAGGGLAVLMGQFDRTISKYPELAKGSDSFADAWKTTQQTFSQQLKQTEESLVSLGVKFGTILLPYVQEFLGWIQQGVGWLTQHKGAVVALAGAIGTTLVAAIVGVGVAMFASFGWVEAIVIGVMAVGAGIAYAYQHFKVFRTVVDDVGRVIGTTFKVAWQAAGAVVNWFRTTVLPPVRNGIADLVAWFTAHKAEFSAAWSTVLHDVEKLVKWFQDNVLKFVQDKTAEFTKWWKAHSEEIHTAWRDVWDAVATVAKVIFDLIGGYIRLAVGFWSLEWGLFSDTLKLIWGVISDTVTYAIHYVKNIIDFVLDLISGKWGAAWGDLKRLVTQAFSDIGKTLSDLTSNFGTLLEDAGKNLIRGLINGIKSMVGTVKSTVGDVVGGIKGFFNNSPAKEGPLAGTGGPDYMGATFGRMLADGMHSSVGVVSRASSALAGAASLTVGGGPLPGLAGAGGYSSGGSGTLAVSGGFGALAVGSAGGSTTVVNNHFHIQGSVLSERDLRDVMERQMYQLGGRGSTTWQSYARR